MISNDTIQLAGDKKEQKRHWQCHLECHFFMGDTLQAQQSGAAQQNASAGRTRIGEDIKAMGGVALGIGLEGVSLYFR